MLFKEIIGQDKIKNKLIETVKQNRVCHAQLFFGPEGCGKLALAVAYAQYISCEDKKDDDSCGVCRSCLKFNKLAHPDLHFFYPVASTKKVSKPTSKDFINQWINILISNNCYLSIDEWYKEIDIENKQGIINAQDCNEIIRILGLKSYESEYKTVIIWMADKLFHSAAPKILKILEDPPDKTLFLLISDNTDRIINTIKSRTQLIKIPKISDEYLLSALTEKHALPKNEAYKIVKLSEGNYIKAVAGISSDEDNNYYYTNFRKWMQMCFKMDIPELIGFIGEISVIGRERQKNLLSYGLKIIRESIVLNFQNRNLTRLNEEEEEFCKKFSSFINSSNVDIFYEEFNNSIYQIERNANPKILFTDLSFTVSRLIKNS